jgi:hypothetical protein
MNSRERVEAALAHRLPDSVPLDLGGSAVSGMHASSVYALRQALGLDRPGTPVKVTEPYQMLGEVAGDLMDALGIDVVGVGAARNMFGFANEGWKEWRFHDGTPLLVPGAFNTSPEPNGDILMYPEGDRSVPPSGRMPAGGYYFDSTRRQPPIDESRLDPRDNLEEFAPIAEADLRGLAARTESARATGRAILANFGGTGFGDIALVPGPWLKNPRGIRDVEEWYVSTAARADYVWKVFEGQCEIALSNLAAIHRSVGDTVSVVLLSGTDFGAQHDAFISPRSYRDLFMPFHKRLNDWVHANTSWKCFIHSCGSVMKLIPSFIEAGFDVLNPVQTTAADMDGGELKRRFGDRLTFWGGGVDTQKVLPFGTPAEVRRDVERAIRTFSPGGGFVFNTIHNVQAKVPPANLVALYEAVRDFRRGR